MQAKHLVLTALLMDQRVMSCDLLGTRIIVQNNETSNEIVVSKNHLHIFDTTISLEEVSLHASNING
jgi:hypothetical protein